MSLRAATTKQEAIFQYCNYGYDKSKYTSREDCMSRYNPSQKFNEPTIKEQVMPQPNQNQTNQGQTIQIGQSPPVDASKLVRFTFFMGLGLGALITVIIYKIRS
jgi:hypothetical protein